MNWLRNRSARRNDSNESFFTRGILADVAQHQIDHDDYQDNKQDGKTNAHCDEVGEFTAGKVSFAIATRLHAEGGGKRAANYLQEAERFLIWFFVGTVRLIHGEFMGSFSTRVTQ